MENKLISKIISGWMRKGISTIYVCCSCVSNSDHHLIITRDTDDLTQFFATVVESDAGSIWARIKYAWRYIWSGPYHDTIVVEKEEMIELGKTLVALVAETETSVEQPKPVDEIRISWLKKEK